jgi:hypothetical protein
MYKVRGDGPGVHFNVGLSDAEKTELSSISLEALLATRKGVFSSGVSLYRGVSWHKRKQNWLATISIRRKTKNLGCFSLEEDAAKAYDRAAKYEHGRYVSICFIMRMIIH